MTTRGVEEPVQGHKRLQGVPLHKPHGISELGICRKRWKIIICFTMHFPGIAIGIACNGVAMEEGSPDNRIKGQIWG